MRPISLCPLKLGPLGLGAQGALLGWARLHLWDDRTVSCHRWHSFGTARAALSEERAGLLELPGVNVEGE